MNSLKLIKDFLIPPKKLEFFLNIREVKGETHSKFKTRQWSLGNREKTIIQNRASGIGHLTKGNRQ